MAFTEQNEKDGYLFFVVAFNAVPGKTYAAQVVEAYEAGMTTQQIVNEFTTKPAFTDIYGSDLSNAEFAQSFVTNVTANLTGAAAISATVQAQAIADIEAALDAGLSIGDVITNVITNITNKSVADAEWGSLVQLLINKVAVAEALTEGEFALDTTDAGALQAPLALVTVNPATVQEAITKGGALKALLANALAADNAVEDYADGLGLLDNNDDPITGSAAVKAELGARLDTAVTDAGLATNYAAYANQTTTQQNQAIASVKTTAANNIALAQDDLTAANSAVSKVATLAKKGADWDAAVTASDNADKAAALAEVEVTNQVNVYNIGKTAGTDSVDAGAVAGTYEIGGTVVIKTKADGTFEFDAAASTAQKTGLAALLKALNDEVAADKAATAAATAEINAKAAVDALDTAAGGAGAAEALLQDVKDAKKDLADAQEASTDLDAALADLTAYAAQLKQLDGLQQAATAAGDKLTDAGYTLKDLDGTAVAVDTIKAIFLLTADSVTGTSTTGAFESGDGIYVGSGYTLNTTADLTKGNNSALEVFFKTNGANTDVYIEQKAFGSNVADAANGANGDIIKVTLTGVAAEDVSLVDGFITVAA